MKLSPLALSALALSSGASASLGHDSRKTHLKAASDAGACDAAQTAFMTAATSCGISATTSAEQLTSAQRSCLCAVPTSDVASACASQPSVAQAVKRIQDMCASPLTASASPSPSPPQSQPQEVGLGGVCVTDGRIGSAGTCEQSPPPQTSVDASAPAPSPTTDFRGHGPVITASTSMPVFRNPFATDGSNGQPGGGASAIVTGGSGTGNTIVVSSVAATTTAGAPGKPSSSPSATSSIRPIQTGNSSSSPQCAQYLTAMNSAGTTCGFTPSNGSKPTSDQMACYCKNVQDALNKAKQDSQCANDAAVSTLSASANQVCSLMVSHASNSIVGLASVVASFLILA
ncbi:hypothetical protein BC830DRAFT_1150069 [Chytriomyces sp. MP71]|nr:hypothetical protein BC830DRAFT_1150069 [Chytriomyces sp. MP71]